jgi:DNA repair exonuclease SbcCD ATPase subunit
MECESSERTKEIESLMAQHERLIQSQRNAEATRQTAVQKIERLEQRLTAASAQINAMRDAAANLATLQQELAEAEQAWADVDERIQSNEDDADLLRQRETLSARLDVLHLQRDEMIGDIARTANRPPAAIQS